MAARCARAHGLRVHGFKTPREGSCFRVPQALMVLSACARAHAFKGEKSARGHGCEGSWFGPAEGSQGNRRRC
eukprot:3940616-Rhodomonas_salina.2